MKLADEWKSAWRWLQTWLVLLLSMAPICYEQFAGLKDYLPPAWFHVGMAVLGLATLVNTVRQKAAAA